MAYIRLVQLELKRFWDLLMNSKIDFLSARV